MSLAPAPSLLDEILETHRAAIGADFEGYRGHAHRVFQFARALVPASLGRDDVLAVAAAFHDIAIWTDGTFDYLGPSAARARAFASERLPGLDPELVARAIELHHKVTSAAAEGPVAEAFRRADLVDVSFGLVKAGVPAELVREARDAFPNAGFHRCLLRVSTAWIRRNPLRPMPMMRW